VGEALGVAQDQASARWGAVVAIHGEKDLRELLGPLAARDFKRVFATTVPGTGVHHAAAAVAQAADALGLEAEVHDLPEGALRSALEWAEEDGADPVSGAPAGVMVTGSLYLVGALRARLQAPTNPG
jgi:folylpolyglutamate synthase/dihydropteroate synthase